MRFAGIKLSNYMDTPDFGLQAQQSLVSQSQERQAASTATWMGDMAESKGAAEYEMGKAQGQAVAAQGAAAGQASIFGGIMDGIGTFGSAFIKKPNTGFKADPVGSQGNPSFPSSIPTGSYPGGPAVGGGRIPLNG